MRKIDINLDELAGTSNSVLRQLKNIRNGIDSSGFYSHMRRLGSEFQKSGDTGLMSDCRHAINYFNAVLSNLDSCYNYINETSNLYLGVTGEELNNEDFDFISVLIKCPVRQSVVSGLVTQIAISAVSYTGMAIASIWDEGIRADMNAIGWNPFNSNEAMVLGSNKVSFYKGAPVFLKDGGRSGSFYAISLDRNSSADTLRHEWGHNVQAMKMGPVNYGLTVGVMSPPALRESKWGGYYNSPWETGADMFGGVHGRTHTSAELSRAKWYLEVGTLHWPAAYLFLI